MKERPILFSGPMVRAVQSGCKTQTRRAVKIKGLDFQGGGPVGGPDWLDPSCWGFEDGNTGRQWALAPGEGVDHVFPSRYGQPGDRLYVRENGWQRPERTPKMMRDGADTWKPYYFDADGLTEQDVADFKAWGFKRRPSIHMPRAHSRILLEIVSVRVERLQDISEADAIAEGIMPHVRGGWHWHRHDPADLDDWHQFGFKTAAFAYESLWEQINGPGSWALNPWVWVVEFKRIAA